MHPFPAGMLAQGPAGGGGVRPQDVFATSLSTGNGAPPRISTGFKPDLVWDKARNAAGDHFLRDALRGSNFLRVNTADPEAAGISPDFSDTGYTGLAVDSGTTAVGWALKFAPKFFVAVAYTGNGTSGRQIPHNLGIAPGMMVVKKRNATAHWWTYHRSLTNPATDAISLNNPDAASSVGSGFFGANPTSTVFTVGSVLNSAGETYVAYLFAHDPDPNGIIQCGSVTTGSNGVFSVPLPWAAQWVLFKSTGTADSWYIFDTTRGASGGSGSKGLQANSSAAEFSGSGLTIASPGFFCSATGNFDASTQHIWAAIRAPI